MIEENLSSEKEVIFLSRALKNISFRMNGSTVLFALVNEINDYNLSVNAINFCVSIKVGM